MSEEYGNDYITLTDEDGNEIELEHLDTVEYNNQTYMAFLPANAALEESYDLIIMKIELEENGEEVLVTLDDEDEESELFQIFSERLEESFYGNGEKDSDEPDEEAEAEKEGY
jgi:Protein of unknown function (DUF1292).